MVICVYAYCTPPCDTTDDTTEEESSTADQDLDRHDPNGGDGPVLLNEAMSDVLETPDKLDIEDEESEAIPSAAVISKILTVT